MKEYSYLKKSEIKSINLKNLCLTPPDLKSENSPKAVVISQWMTSWIEKGLKENTIMPNMLLPKKEELAYFLGVSIGTVQNAIRNLEDKGYVISKQRIGTAIVDISSEKPQVRKLTSKRESAIAAIKNFIITNKMKVGNILPSSRAMASLIGFSNNTTRSAFEYLYEMNIISKLNSGSTDYIWKIISLDFTKNENDINVENKTLVDKLEADIKDYISQELSIGDKIPAHDALAERFKVSIKTIHDALKPLIKEGILLARRGKYGTVVIKKPYETNKYEGIEKSIFAPAKETAFYYYEKTQNLIKRMIVENYDIGSKLPSIMALSREMDLSPNTIRKAFHNLAKDGYLRFARGRYGGTFVVDIPPTGEEAFKWIAVNPQYTRIMTSN